MLQYKVVTLIVRNTFSLIPPTVACYIPLVLSKRFSGGYLTTYTRRK
jgi:hypothetical protein